MDDQLNYIAGVHDLVMGAFHPERENVPDRDLEPEYDGYVDGCIQITTQGDRDELFARIEDCFDDDYSISQICDCIQAVIDERR